MRRYVGRLGAALALASGCLFLHCGDRDSAGPDSGAEGSAEASVGPGGGDAGGGSFADSGDDSATSDTCTTATDADAAAGCYAITCTATPQSLTANRDRLIADIAKRKCTDSCSFWAALNEAERYIFLMDTAYLGDATSSLYPQGYNKADTALDHAVALYSINGPLAGQGTDSSGRGGNDYNRIYLGFDGLAKCVMRNFAAANPTKTPGYNEWVTSDDVAGPHAPFTQREMIFWYKALYDLQSEGPQFHHWHQDSDFTQSGLDARLGVCGVTDPSITELTIAFDTFHNSDPLGDYSGRGGYGWQIVDTYDTIPSDWAYAPTGCIVTAPVNTDPYGGGTFAGMGPSLDGGACTAPKLGISCAP